MQNLGNVLLKELELVYDGRGMRVYRIATEELRWYGILAAAGVIKEVARDNGADGWVDYEITTAGDAMLAAIAADPIKFQIQPQTV